jgi:hypothetical protein
MKSEEEPAELASKSYRRHSAGMLARRQPHNTTSKAGKMSGQR